MSYGFTPYDKKSYKASKKRRRQALKAERTGRIEPFSTAKRRAIVITCILLAFVVAVGGFIVYSKYFADDKTNLSQQEAQSVNEELLAVVNRQNSLDSTYIPELEDFQNIKVNVLALDSLKEMIEKAKEQGIELKINSAYVSYEQQDELYNVKLSEFLANPDYTQVRAEAATQKLVPQAGCCEAQTGLLIDFDVTDEKARAFIERNCVNYGFILRYPQDKEDLTHLQYSDSLYRYVGKDNAVKMRSYNMCLEEYAEYISLQKL